MFGLPLKKQPKRVYTLGERLEMAHWANYAPLYPAEGWHELLKIAKCIPDPLEPPPQNKENDEYEQEDHEEAREPSNYFVSRYLS